MHNVQFISVGGSAESATAGEGRGDRRGGGWRVGGGGRESEREKERERERDAHSVTDAAWRREKRATFESRGVWRIKIFSLVSRGQTIKQSRVLARGCTTHARRNNYPWVDNTAAYQ